jgi:exodeoxyribonuclease-3
MKIKLISWNVNGIRAIHKKGFLEWFNKQKADIVCLQETKAHQSQLPPELHSIENYESFWHLGERKGYSGVGTYTRLKPLQTKTTFPYLILSQEGRIIETEFEKFYLFNVYFPNGGMGEHRLQYKLRFYDDFLEYIQSLSKPVIICGDVNTAHTEIDLARPKENRNVSGFMDIERKWLDKIFSLGFIDTFRIFNQESGNYTWWDMKTKSRERNVGWRIDYFIVSPELKPHVLKSEIYCEVIGSDHCPISLEIEI